MDMDDLLVFAIFLLAFEGIIFPLKGGLPCSKPSTREGISRLSKFNYTITV